MSESKPTPWRAESNAGWGHCVRGGTRINVGTGQEEEGYIAVKLRSMAHARLFAASRDLLAALKYARRFLNAPDMDVAFIDAALAKATGEPYQPMEMFPADRDFESDGL